MRNVRGRAILGDVTVPVRIKKMSGFFLLALLTNVIF